MVSSRNALVQGGVLGASFPSVAAGPFAVSIADLPPNKRLPRHAHSPATLNLVVAGEYGEAIERGPMRQHGPLTLIVKPPATVHSNSIGVRTRCVVVEIEPAKFEGLRPAGLDRDVTVFRDPWVGQYARLFLRELSHPDNVSPLVLEGLTLELIAHFCRMRPTPYRESWLRRAEEILNEDLPPSLAELAYLVGRHPVYLARAFRAKFGCSVGEYSRTRRLCQARDLLLSTDLPLVEVAHRAGYADQSHMSRHFKRALGVSPGRLRNRGAYQA
jgi:AraC family transcriptional regulator